MAKLGYDDGPLIEGTPWRVHDSNRPQPRIVTPGTESSEAKPAEPPSDAIILFDGTNLAGWQGAIWQGADSKVQDRASDAVRRGVAAATCAATRLMRTIDAQSVEAYEQEVELRA